MVHHYITKYYENGKRYAEAWVQIDLFKWCLCLFKRKIQID